MNLWEALQTGRRLLSQVSEEAELDAELLLRHCINLDRAGIYRRLHEELSEEQEDCYRKLVGRRIVHEPTAYILGHKEFFGLEFEVTPAAILPRPETEVLVEMAIDFLRRLTAPRRVTAVDVGTGCGTIAVALARSLPKAEIIAVDVSGAALALARRNAERLGAGGRIRLIHGDMLSALRASFDAIVANLPYVRTEDWEVLPREIREHEPRAGLDGGPDGLYCIDRLLRDAPRHLAPGGALFAEIGDDQGEAARGIARDAFPAARIDVRPDLAGLDRVLVIETD